MSWSQGNAAACGQGHNSTMPLLSDSSASAWDKPQPGLTPGLTLTPLVRLWLLPRVGGCREPTSTREVCGEAQGREVEQWGALHLFEMEWRQLRALLTAISAWLGPGNPSSSQEMWEQPALSKATPQEDCSLLELSFTAQRHLPAQPGLSAASVLASVANQEGK